MVGGWKQRRASKTLRLCGTGSWSALLTYHSQQNTEPWCRVFGIWDPLSIFLLRLIPHRHTRGCDLAYQLCWHSFLPLIEPVAILSLSNERLNGEGHGQSGPHFLRRHLQLKASPQLQNLNVQWRFGHKWTMVFDCLNQAGQLLLHKHEWLVIR